jgi:hypothetical protein
MASEAVSRVVERPRGLGGLHIGGVGGGDGGPGRVVLKPAGEGLEEGGDGGVGNLAHAGEGGGGAADGSLRGRMLGGRGCAAGRRSPAPPPAGRRGRKAAASSGVT